MLKIWDAANFRRTLEGLSLILAPLLFAVVEIAHPAHDSDAASALARAAHDRSLELAYNYLLIASSLLFIPAFFALLHVVRGRGVVLAHVAGMLGLVGAGLTLSRAGLQLMIWAMAAPGLDQKAMTAFLNTGVQGPGAPLFLGPLLFSIGISLFGIAVWRSGFGYRWAGPLVALGIAAAIVGSIAGLPDLPVAIVSAALWVIGFAAIGFRLLTMSDTAWESGVVTVTTGDSAAPGSTKPPSR